MARSPPVQRDCHGARALIAFARAEQETVPPGAKIWLRTTAVSLSRADMGSAAIIPVRGLQLGVSDCQNSSKVTEPDRNIEWRSGHLVEPNLFEGRPQGVKG
jgi:hypothetical protein